MWWGGTKQTLVLSYLANLRKDSSPCSTLGFVGNGWKRKTNSGNTWGPPWEDVVKVNFDSSMSREKVAGLGLVARDFCGAVLVAASTYPFVVLLLLIDEATTF